MNVPGAGHVHLGGPDAAQKLFGDTDGQIDILVAGLGTGGTLCGAGRFLRSRKPDVRLVAVEPAEAPYISQGVFQPHRMMGTAPGFVPVASIRPAITLSLPTCRG